MSPSADIKADFPSSYKVAFEPMPLSKSIDLRSRIELTSAIISKILIIPSPFRSPIDSSGFSVPRAILAIIIRSNIFRMPS